MSFVFKTGVELESVRLRLRSYRKSDNEELFKGLFSDKEVLKDFCIPYFNSMGPFERFINGFVNSLRNEKRYFLVAEDRTSRAVMGFFIQNNAWDPYHNSINLGYGLAKKYWNQGYGTEMVSMITDFFGKMGIHRLEAECFKENMGSVRVLEKCGFKREGEKIEEIKYQGAYRSSWCYYWLNHN